VAVVGGGAIGVCCALELARRGARVVLYERGPALASGCSAGNAGLICPSHSTPIANPASLRNGLRWMWTRDSPFYLRPRPAVLPWLARFALAARHSEAGAQVIRELSIAGLELHAELGEELGTSFERTGTLNVYESHDGLEAEARAAARSGLPFEVFDADGTREFEPALVGPMVGSVRYPTEGRVDPRRFVETVGAAAAAAGAEIRTGTAVRSLAELDAGTVIVAAGAWSKQLVRLPLEGGKGYHVDYERSEEDPRIPAWVQETWTIATPTQGICSITSNTLNCSLGTIAAGASVTVTVSTPATTPVAACTSQPNPAANATATGGLTATDSGSLTCTPPPAQLKVVKTPDGGSFTMGGQATFTITVSNPAAAGSASATSVTLTDALPTNGGLTWTSATPRSDIRQGSQIAHDPQARQWILCVLRAQLVR